MPEVKRRNTPWSVEFAAKKLTEAMPGISRDAAELLLAQVWLETGRGKSVQNNSPGNITSSAKTGDFWRPTWYVVTEASSPRDLRLNKLMLAGKAPRAFRAYETPESGFLHYIQFLSSSRYEPLLVAAALGDVAAFARAVRDTGYCPDCDPAKTEPTFRALREEFRRDNLFEELSDSDPQTSGATKKLIWAALIAILIVKVHR